jgi:hypothetical protein
MAAKREWHIAHALEDLVAQQEVEQAHGPVVHQTVAAGG